MRLPRISAAKAPALLAVALATALIAIPATAQAQPTVGACVWNRLSDPIRADFLAAYPDKPDTRSLNRALIRLSRYNGAAQVAGRACTRTDPPGAWIARATVAHAVQLGSAALLAREAGLARTQLDAVWRGASDTARTCLRAAPGKRFGLKMPACPDEGFEAALLQPLRLVRPDHRGHAMNYLRAAAASQIAEALIARGQVTPE